MVILFEYLQHMRGMLTLQMMLLIIIINLNSLSYIILLIKHKLQFFQVSYKKFHDNYYIVALHTYVYI